MTLGLAEITSILAFLSAICAFFYQKDGKRVEVRGVGLIVLALVVVVGGLNLYSAFRAAAQKEAAKLQEQAAKAEAELLKAENRRSQSALQMQYLDVEKPFTYGLLSFSIYNRDELTPDAPMHPLGDDNLVLFGRTKEPGQPIGALWTDISEFTNASARLSTDDKGRVIVEQGFSSEVQNNMTYPLEGDECSGEEGCQQAEGRELGIEALAAMEGTYHLSLNLDETTRQPAMVSLSRLMQSSHVGGVVIHGARKTAKVEEVASYFRQHLAGRLYFVQEYDASSPIAQCRRTARLPVKLLLRDAAPDYIGADCTANDLCFEMVHEFNMTVNACQISEV